MFALSEPVLMFLFGTRLAKKNYKIRQNYLDNKKNAYLLLMFIDCVLMFAFGATFLINVYIGLFVYAMWAFFSLSCRIYRQRFTRNYAEFNKIPFQRLVAVTNFLTRGAPLLAPLVLILFEQQDWFVYLGCAFVMTIAASSAFYFSYKRIWRNNTLSMPSTKKMNSSLSNPNMSNAWAKWHVIN